MSGATAARTPAQKVNDHYAEAYGKGNYQSCEAYIDFRHVLDRAGH